MLPAEKLKCKRCTRCRWLTPVILATWEAQIEGMIVPGQSRQKKKKVYETPSQPIAGCGGVHLSSQLQQEA
jgi:hypothetical protein